MAKYEPFQIEVRGVDRLRKVLESLKVALNDKQTLNEIISAELFNTTERTFANKADPATGEEWAPWSKSYEKRLRKLGVFDRSRMLERHGDLRDAIMFWADNEGAHIGANLVYARIHQLGGGSVRPGYPARPYLGLDSDAYADIRANLLDHLTAAIRT